MINGFITGLIAGILIGAGVGGHVLRLVVLYDEYQFHADVAAAFGMPATTSVKGRALVALAAVALYSVAAVLVMLGQDAGLWVALGGPLVGLAAVLALHAQVDSFQRALGVFQAIASVLAAYMLFG